MREWEFEAMFFTFSSSIISMQGRVRPICRLLLIQTETSLVTVADYPYRYTIDFRTGVYITSLTMK